MMAEDPEHIFFHPEFGQLHTTDLQHCLDIDPSFDTLLFSSNEEIKRLFSPYCNSINLPRSPSSKHSQESLHAHMLQR